MDAAQIQSYARQLFEVQGAKAIAEAALIEMRGPRHS